MVSLGALNRSVLKGKQSSQLKPVAILWIKLTRASVTLVVAEMRGNNQTMRVVGMGS